MAAFVVACASALPVDRTATAQSRICSYGEACRSSVLSGSKSMSHRISFRDNGNLDSQRSFSYSQRGWAGSSFGDASRQNVPGPITLDIQASGAVHDVTIVHDGKSHVIKVSEDTTILQAGQDAGIDLPNSCLAGVCTTCSARIVSGQVDQTEAVLSPEVKEQGFVLLCSAYPRSACKVETVAEDQVYDEQFGKYEAITRK